tara:strand:- start:236 stop:853 length:618 start_codon:yes stop_codon:yes gene_type:complete
MSVDAADKNVHTRFMTPGANVTKNREDLLVAAQEVFAQKGVDAPLDLVRQRAGVGRATMYRNFPGRVHLQLALVEDSLRRLETRDPGEAQDMDAFTAFLFAIADEVGRSPALNLLWDRLREDPEMSAPHIKRLCTVIAAPLALAIHEGSVSPRLTIEDIYFAVRMLGVISRGASLTERRAAARRALSLLFAGLGTTHHSTRETDQ